MAEQSRRVLTRRVLTWSSRQADDVAFEPADLPVISRRGPREARATRRLLTWSSRSSWTETASASRRVGDVVVLDPEIRR